jgi:hypothetical protein
MMLYAYIWVEGEKNLNDFCVKRFGAKPSFTETIGHCDSATIYRIDKFDERKQRYTDMYLLIMQAPSGTLTHNEIIDKIYGMSYDEIRADRRAILR